MTRKGQRVKPAAKPAAKPVRSKAAANRARIFADMQKIWRRMPQVGDSTEIISDGRDR